jgi:hypothetical protein
MPLVDSCNVIDARTLDRGLARNDCAGVRESERKIESPQ